MNAIASAKRFHSVVIVILALLSVGGYLAWNYAQGLTGFPLDDAWIHQTFARNLAETGQLAYLRGQPSAGSTSPAWSFLLSVGYLLGIDFRVWAYLLGGLSLAATAWLTYRLLLRLSPSKTTAALSTGLFCAVEWHLVWAAASGMETMVFTALSLALLEYFFSQVATRQSPVRLASLRKEQAIVSAVGIGLLGGILTLTRPEGLALAGLVILGLIFLPRPISRGEIVDRLLTAGVSLFATAVILVPYLAFNLRTAGTVFPNTFYAKQTEYQIDWPLPIRFWSVLSSTLVGGQVLLLPGFVYVAYRLVRHRKWPATLPLLWWLAFLTTYALRLPVNYQHGRYVIPTIPLLLLYGIWGTALLLRPHSPHLLVRVLSRGVPVAVAVLALLFWVRGALAYRDDVGFIDGEMVATAHWLNQNTSRDDRIAVHDIGAVGYWTDRPLLDLAGLITPEVIPFMTDAEQLKSWMLQRGAAYAVFFPDFSPTYTQLAADPGFEAVHCTNYPWTRATGHENMCVYRVIDRNRP
jgi:arabinofuranosyltransferase